jgi:hypothetical protein
MFLEGKPAAYLFSSKKLILHSFKLYFLSNIMDKLISFSTSFSTGFSTLVSEWFGTTLQMFQPQPKFITNYQKVKEVH